MNTSGAATPEWSEVLALVAQLDSSGLVEAEVVADGVSVRVSRVAGALASPAAPPAAPASTAPVPTPEPGAAAPQAPAPAPAATPADDLVEVIAPMLGVLYRRPAPDQPEFVSVGDIIEAGATVAIIEVMKLMNPVVAEVGGRVAEVVVDDGAQVEHGTVLLRLEPVGGGAGT